MPSLGRVDRVHTKKGSGHEQWYWESPGAQDHSYAAVGPSQYGRPVVSGTSLGAAVNASALSTREVAFPLMLEVEGSSSRGIRRHGLLVIARPSRLKRNIPPEA